MAGPGRRLFAARAAALDAHLRANGSGSLAGRLRATAGYLDDVADWQRRSRDRMARALGEVLTSTQALTLTRHLSGGGPGRTSARAEAVRASADVGARLLAEAVAALDEGEGVRQRWPAAWPSSPSWRRPTPDPAPVDSTIEMRH